MTSDFREEPRMTNATHNAADAVQVKPLKWSIYNEGFGHGRTYYGTGVFGHWYAVKRERQGVWSGLHHVGKDMVHFPYFRSLDEAKAAAQADYIARVRSALAAAPAPADQPVAWVCKADLEWMRRDDGADFSVSPRIRPELGMEFPLYAAPAEIEKLREENAELRRALDLSGKLSKAVHMKAVNAENVAEKAFAENGELLEETARIRKLAVEALEPFSKMAGALFERNFNATNIIESLRASDGAEVIVVAGHYFNARAALTSIKEGGNNA